MLDTCVFCQLVYYIDITRDSNNYMDWINAIAVEESTGEREPREEIEVDDYSCCDIDE